MVRPPTYWEAYASLQTEIEMLISEEENYQRQIENSAFLGIKIAYNYFKKQLAKTRSKRKDLEYRLAVLSL